VFDGGDMIFIINKTKKKEDMGFLSRKCKQYFAFQFAFLLAGLVFVSYTGLNEGSWKDEKPEVMRFSKVKLADNFDEPMEMAIMDDGKVMVIERKGAIKLYSPETNSIKKIAAMPVYSGQEDGLLGVVLDPQF
jgi:cytochrome c